MAEEESMQRAVEVCATAEAMIDINAEHLDGLRTQCSTAHNMTQHEIRTLESKLIKLFSRQLVAKLKSPRSAPELVQYPRLHKWLQVVGLCEESRKRISGRVSTMEVLLQLPEQQVKEVMHAAEARDEEKRRLLIALRNLKAYTDRQIRGEISSAADLDLHWDSWDRAAHAAASPRARRVARSSVPSEELLKTGPAPQLPFSSSASVLLAPHTPPPTPPSSGGRRGRPPTTPPPCRKLQANLGAGGQPPTLTKSRSHEEQLAAWAEQAGSQNEGPRRRLPTETDCDSPISHEGALQSPRKIFDQHTALDSANDSPPFQTIPVPRSPRPQGMAHVIHHRFTSSLKVGTCQFCDKPMFFGLKCKECKFRCHRDCVEKVPPSCGLPQELVNVFVQTMHKDGTLGHLDDF